MKILIFENSGVMDGGQRVTLEILRFLSTKMPVNQILVVLGAPGPLEDHLKKMRIAYYIFQMPSMTMGKKSLQDFFSYWRFKTTKEGQITNLVKDFGADLFYVPGSRFIGVATTLAGKLGIPCIWHLHHYYQDPFTRIYLSYLASRKSVSKIISVSNFVASKFPKGLQRSKISILPNYFYLSDLKRIESKPFHKNQTPLKLGVLGNIKEHKRQHIVAEAAKILKLQGFKLTLRFAGRIDEEHYWQQIQSILKEPSNGLSWEYLGYINRLDGFFEDLDFLIIPSQEGFPLVALESIAFGIPFICADGSGTKEIADTSGGGATYLFDNVESLVSIIRDNAHPRVRESLRNNSLKFISGKNFKNIYFEEIRKILEHTVHEGGQQ